MTAIKWHVIKSNKDLPRAGRFVLVTKISRGRRCVDVDTPIYGWRNTIEDEQVIAWAELPEPYQGKLK